MLWPPTCSASQPDRRSAPSKSSLMTISCWSTLPGGLMPSSYTTPGGFFYTINTQFSLKSSMKHTSVLVHVLVLFQHPSSWLAFPSSDLVRGQMRLKNHQVCRMGVCAEWGSHIAPAASLTHWAKCLGLCPRMRPASLLAWEWQCGRQWQS